ncbi:hypothetical protein, partial [Nocardiopsis ansamitocini]|uniref:hypothetical protein n=1 Tax=Nocardiopsis ansamitocini TaxID=1670832 RepID=UPI002557039C
TTTNGETTNQTATRDALSPEAATHTGANDLHVNMAGTPDPNDMDIDWTDPAQSTYGYPDYYDLDTLGLASPTNDDLAGPSFLTDDPGPSTDYTPIDPALTTDYTHAMDTDDMSWLTPDDSMDWATLAHDITTDLNTGFDPGFGI